MYKVFKERRQKGSKFALTAVLLSLLSASPFIAGCAALPPAKAPVGERIINKPYDVVWDRAIASLPRAGEFSIGMDEETGSIVLEKLVQGCHLLSEYSGFDWYYGRIQVNISIGSVSAESTRVAVGINFTELHDITRGDLDILDSAEVYREEILFANLSTEAHYLDYIENAVKQEKVSKRTFLGRVAWAMENLPTKTSWGW